MSHTHLTELEPQTQAMFDELSLVPESEEDEQQLIKILRFFLSYPSNQLADIHRRASRLGNFDEITSREMLKQQYITKANEYNTCECCYSIVQESTLKPFTKIENIVTLGEATKLFFNDLKFGIFMLVISFFLYGIYAFATNVSASNSNSISCFQNKTCKLAVISLGSKLYTENSSLNRRFYIAQNYLGLLMIILWAAVFIWKTFQERKITMMMDKHAATASDFTVMFTNLPKYYNKEILQAKLDEYADNMKQLLIHPLDNAEEYDGKFTISRFNPVKAYYETMSMSREIQTRAERHLEKAMEKLRDLIRKRKNIKGFTTIKSEREDLYRLIDELRVEVTGERLRKLKIIQETYRRKHASEPRIVFVTFNHSYAKINLLRLNQFSLFKTIKMRLRRKHNENSIDIEGVQILNAPEPEDVVWENIGVSRKQRYTRRFITIFITLMILGGSFGATYGLSKVQMNGANSNNVIISFLISLVINAVNVVIESITQNLTVQQKHYTTSQFQISIAFKIVFSQLFNSIIIGMMGAVYIKKNIYQQGGLVDDVFYFGLINMIFPPLARLVNPQYILRRIMRYYYSTSNQKLYYESQVDFNQKWEGAEFQVGLEYAYLLKTVIYTSFFMALQPIIIVFGVIGIFFMYQAQKFCLFYQSIRPKPSSNIITTSMNSLYYLSIIAYGLGSLTWTNFLPDGGGPRYTLAPNILCILIGASLYFVTFGDLTDLMVEQKYAGLIYQKQRLFLPTEYDRLNPNTRSEGIKSFIRYLESKKKQHQLGLKDKNTKQNLNYISKMLFQSKFNSQMNNQQDFKGSQQTLGDKSKHRERFSEEQQVVYPLPKGNFSKISRLQSMFNRREQINVQAALSRIKSQKIDEGVETNNRLEIPETENMEVSSKQLKSIIAINSIMKKPSIISTKFNPMHFIEAVHDDRRKEDQSHH